MTDTLRLKDGIEAAAFLGNTEIVDILFSTIL